MSTGAWYVRSKGKVFGPFDEAQLESLRRRGGLARFDELSQDRVQWTSAQELGEVFNSRRGVQSASVAVENAPMPPTAPARSDGQSRWYYARDGATVGPVSRGELDGLVATGGLSPLTHVWREGMPGWAFYADTRIGPPPSKTPEQQGPPGSPLVINVQPSSGTRVDLLGSSQPQQLPRTSGLAVASLVLGLLFLCGIGSILAIIFGSVAIGQINRSQGLLLGKGMAIAGLVLGILGVSGLLVLWSRAFLVLQ